MGPEHTPCPLQPTNSTPTYIPMCMRATVFTFHYDNLHNLPCTHYLLDRNFSHDITTPEGQLHNICYLLCLRLDVYTALNAYRARIVRQKAKVAFRTKMHKSYYYMDMVRQPFLCVWRMEGRNVISGVFPWFFKLFLQIPVSYEQCIPWLFSCKQQWTLLLLKHGSGAQSSWLLRLRCQIVLS